MNDIVRRVDCSDTETAEGLDRLLTREWLITNGLGGYASGTISGAVTRRYHGLLIAALPAPFGRMVMLNHLSELIRLPDKTVIRLGGEEKADGTLELYGTQFLKEFRLEAGIPVWHYEIRGRLLEKRVHLIHMQNTVHITYRLLSGNDTIRLKLMPSVHFRSHEAAVTEKHMGPYVLTAVEDRYQLSCGTKLPPLRLVMRGRRATFTLEGKEIPSVYYRDEAHRGYESTGDLWSPGYFAVDLQRGEDATLIASTEKWEALGALTPEEAYDLARERRKLLLSAADRRARSGTAAELVLAADQFIITPAGRLEDAARVHATGDEVRTVIAGYHWFTDWGRDTMISLEGLTLATGRHAEAGWILRTFSNYIRDGLIPNLFPEGENQGLYHTADATLWFFQAIHRYLEVTGDRATLALLLPKLLDIVDHHVRGTRFGIGIDPRDGLLRQGEEGYQLTWMDAKVEGWVVTPRRGKAVEINALWYNALKLLENWVAEERGERESLRLAELAAQTWESFNNRFWYDEWGYLYDVVDGEEGDDPACRPNQIFSISLTHPVLAAERWKPVLEVVRERLYTPFGLRSLAPGHPDYKPQYFGNLRARDAAYHQGTVWAWLIGPFIDAWLKVHPGDRRGARELLSGLVSELGEKCIGTVSEIFDAEEPFIPRGCVAQAWSVAEMLRCWIRTEE